MTTYTDTGRVLIRLTCSDGQVTGVQVNSERPEVSQLLRGRTTPQVIRMVSSMFALCGHAQMRAAVLAMSSARGEKCNPTIDQEVRREALREHLWHCLLDLPQLLGHVELKQEFVLGAKAIANGQRDDLYALLSDPSIQGLRMRLSEFDDAQISQKLLPRLSARDSLLAWPRLSSEFCRHPMWKDAAAVTGAITSDDDSATSFFSARWHARFDELTNWASGHDVAGHVGTVSAIPVASSIGRALVETARGLLMHEVVMDGDVVADYLIVAPTEWNFHPQGLLQDQLFGADARDREALQQRVSRLVTTLDPCVPWELEWA